MNALNLALTATCYAVAAQPTYERKTTPPLQAVPANEQVKIEFLTDGNQVYYRRTKKLLPGSDAKTFVALKNAYGKDAKHVYQYSAELPEADPTTFVVLDGRFNFYAKDATHVYEGFESIPGADPKTFVPLDEGYSKDFAHIFKDREVLAGVDPNSVSVRGGIMRSNKGVVVQGTNFPGADASSFQIVQENIGSKHSNLYARDESKVFYCDDGGLPQIVSGADAATFVVLDKESYGSPYAKDKQFVYYGAPRVEEADPQSFRDLNPYGTDAKRVFYAGTRVANADPKTFSVLQIGSMTMSGKPASSYSKDAKSVFYEGRKILKADPATFRGAKETDDFEAFDKDFKYDAGKIVP